MNTTNPNRTVVVVGASARNNMGQVIAKAFLDQGATVVVAGRQKEELNRFASETGARAFTCDITDYSQSHALIEFAFGLQNRLDVVINASGAGVSKSFEETSTKELDNLIALQVKAPFQLFQAATAKMNKGGALIQISSATTKAIIDNYAAYIMTKGAGESLMRALANELGPRGIRANCISPGITDTPMTSQAFASEALAQCFAEHYPLGRVGTCEDVANAAIWLASDGCFMTGENLQINGGLTLRGNPTTQDVIRALS